MMTLMRTGPTLRRPLHTMILLIVMLTLSLPTLVMAQDEEARGDARLENYSQNVSIEGSTALSWILLMFLGVIGLGVMFKNAQRTHLD